MRIPTSPFARALAVLAVSAIPTGRNQAQAEEIRPLEVLGRTVQVRGFPVSEGAPADFSRRREAATETALREVLNARGAPLLQEGSVDQNQVRLIYRDALIVITGRYSNGIICKVEVPTSGLRDGLPADEVTALATRSCRAAEERDWGARGHDRPMPIGTEAVPNLPGVKASIYATDSLSGLFPTLVRDVEVQNVTAASLVRGEDRDDWLPRDGVSQWRYAWFSNGAVLAVRYEPGKSDEYGRSGVGLACTVIAPAAALSRLEQGPFATWCAHAVKRLRPGLTGFVSAVRDYRNKQYETKTSTAETSLPSVGSAFHVGVFPPALTAGFWKTGEVAALPTQ